MKMVILLFDQQAEVFHCLSEFSIFYAFPLKDICERDWNILLFFISTILRSTLLYCHVE